MKRSNDVEGASHRHARVQSLVLHELRGLLRDEVADGALAEVVVLAVELSLDCGHARVAYAVRAPGRTEEEVERESGAAFERAAGFLRARLGALLSLKRTPRLSFTFVGLAPEEGGDA